ncbi:hypothetical protein OPFAMLBM_00263 [Aeromonas phage avDM12-TAAL]|nr:hypothetical protein OPFAMLBM_00263 [Aeromonas phage avDM12-TAAL]
MRIERIRDHDEYCDVGEVTHDYVEVSKEEFDKLRDLAEDRDVTGLCSPPIEFLYSKRLHSDGCEILGKAFLYESEKRPGAPRETNQYLKLTEMPKPYKLVTLMKDDLTLEQRRAYRERVKSGYYKSKG